MIAAVARNNVIGKAGKLPWSIPQDFRYFLQKTTNQIAVMGTNCFLEADHPASLIIVLTHGSELQPYKEVSHTNPLKSSLNSPRFREESAKRLTLWMRR